MCPLHMNIKEFGLSGLTPCFTVSLRPTTQTSFVSAFPGINSKKLNKITRLVRLL